MSHVILQTFMNLSPQVFMEFVWNTFERFANFSIWNSFSSVIIISSKYWELAPRFTSGYGLGARWVWDKSLKGTLRLCSHVKTQGAVSPVFPQLGAKPHRFDSSVTLLPEESCRVKRSDTQTFSNYSKRVPRLPASPNKNNLSSNSQITYQTPTKSFPNTIVTWS